MSETLIFVSRKWFRRNFATCGIPLKFPNIDMCVMFIFVSRNFATCEIPLMFDYEPSPEADSLNKKVTALIAKTEAGIINVKYHVKV